MPPHRAGTKQRAMSSDVVLFARDFLQETNGLRSERIRLR
jgi:hypothetical protein